MRVHFWLIAFLELFLSSPAVVSAQRLYEAENGVYDGFRLLRSPSASNGQFLRIGKSGKVRWTVAVDRDGWYRLKFRYRSSGGESVNGLRKFNGLFSIGFGWTPVWTVHDHCTRLEAGEDTLALSANWGGMDLDWLQVDPIDMAPEIKPRQNQYYRQFPRDLVFKLNTYGRALVGVTADGAEIEYRIIPFPWQEDAWWVRLPAAAISALTDGVHAFTFHLNSGDSLATTATVMDSRPPAAMTIIAPDISHGNSILVILPGSKTLLIDCGKAEQRDATLIPFLRRNGIDRLDYFIITHYHEDHDGNDRGRKIKEEFHVGTFYDNESLKTGEVLDLQGATLRVLNDASAGRDSDDLNAGSLAFNLSYRGFVYHHGGDIYGPNQAAILEKYPSEVRAQLFSANHHFHGSADVSFLRALDPCLVLLQAEQAIYARSTYTEVFRKETAEWLRANHHRYIEDVPALEVGTVVVRVDDGDHWTYETYFDTGSAVVPFLSGIRQTPRTGGLPRLRMPWGHSQNCCMKATTSVDW